METRVIKVDTSADLKARLKDAADLIRRGELVAFPTETVYGLGGDAFNEQAAARIYAAKGRPSDNPLIVHIADLWQVDLAACHIPHIARQVMEHFWPGPLTVILPKRQNLPAGTTGGLDTVAVRMPCHQVARALIRESGTLIAAPSANTSGRPSPTSARHVYEDLEGKIPMILDGGPVGIGIESTILDLTGETPTILRPGFIGRDQLEAVAGKVVMDPALAGRTMPQETRPKAPGMKYRHYAPQGQLLLVEGGAGRVVEEISRLAQEKAGQGYRVGIIATDETAGSYVLPDNISVKSIGSRSDPDSIAASLYGILRDCDMQGFDYIFSESFFEEEHGDAIMNRMLKASAYHLISV